MTNQATNSATEQSSPIFVDLDNMPSMDELLGGDKSSGFAEGTIVEGKVVEKRDNGIMVDIGFKAEGFISKEEVPDWDTIAVGDSVKALLEKIEDEDNTPRLSIEKARLQEAWETFIGKYDEGKVVKGLVKYRVKGGLMVDVGIDAFLPGSQVDLGPVKNMDDFIGKELEFKILKVNKDRRNIVISRRELLEEAKAMQRAELMAEMLPGQLRKGTVKNLTDFGAFVDLHGVDGLLHITDMSWGRVSHPSEILSLGQELEVVILDVDRNKERVSLGLKQKTEDPWDSVEEKLPVGTRIKGKVMNIMPYGAFVQIEEGVEGLIHVSEMSWTKRITRASDVLQPGQEVEAVVLEIQRSSKKISLGLRQTMENPWEVVAREFPPGSRVKGKVRNMTSYGAFVEIKDSIDGMIHVSDMSWTRKINNPGEVLKKGEEVEAIVLEIDPKAQRISLGLKQLSEDPWQTIDKFYKVGDRVKGRVAKLTSFGAFVALDHDIDGLIHISQLSDQRIERVRDVLKVGDEVEARVIKIDSNERRIGLSLREPVETEQAAPQPAQKSDAYNGDDRPLRPGENMVDVGDVISDALEGFEITDKETEKKDQK